MHIEEFISILNNFSKVYFKFPENITKDGELPRFEKLSPYSKYSKSEFSNESIDMYVGHIELGCVHLKLEEGEIDHVKVDRYEASQYMNKKLFIDANPVWKELTMACPEDELYKFSNTELFVSSSPIPEWDGYVEVVINMSNITFGHYEVGEPDYKRTAELALELSKLKANKKVVDWFVSEYGLMPQSDNTLQLNHKHSAKVYEILTRNRINDFGFSPLPYRIKKITPVQIKISGLSSLPKVTDIIKRIKEQKQQTTAGAIMKPMVDKISGLGDDKKADILILANEYEAMVKDCQNNLRCSIYNIILNNGLETKGENMASEEVMVGDFKITINMTN